jgi:hypothetical protein
LARRWSNERQGLRETLHNHQLWLKSFSDKLKAASRNITAPEKSM